MICWKTQSFPAAERGNDLPGRKDLLKPTSMSDPSLRDILVNRVLPRVQFPGQYIGGEWNSICKDHCVGPRPALPGVSRAVHDRHEPLRLAGALCDHERPQ